MSPYGDVPFLLITTIHFYNCVNWVSQYILALKEIVDEETSIFFVTDLAMYMNRHMFIYTGVYFTHELLTLYTNMTAGDSAGVPVHQLGHTVWYINNSFFSLPV